MYVNNITQRENGLIANIAFLFSNLVQTRKTVLGFGSNLIENN